MIQECDLVGCWREENIEINKYTWLKKNPIKKARLYFFLISSTLYNDIENTSIAPIYRTDHSMVTLSLKAGKFKKGKSYWKFMNSLLKYIKYAQQIKEIINRVKIHYTTENQEVNLSSESILDTDIKFDISDKLFFETLMMEIRGPTI